TTAQSSDSDDSNPYVNHMSSADGLRLWMPCSSHSQHSPPNQTASFPVIYRRLISMSYPTQNLTQLLYFVLLFTCFCEQAHADVHVLLLSPHVHQLEPANHRSERWPFCDQHIPKTRYEPNVWATTVEQEQIPVAYQEAAAALVSRRPSMPPTVRSAEFIPSKSRDPPLGDHSLR
ncbi:hypothetical protein FRC12_020658, partial [Ceratobasidium sp. 428]